jgi:hypothetical protein
MEEKINIAEILKDKPQGTKLYDLLYNMDVELDTISTTDIETVVWCTKETSHNTTCHRGCSEFGTVRGCPDGLQILLPSKKMRDWSKFAWKKGDLLVNSCGLLCIFKEWASDDYTEFNGCYSDSIVGYQDVLNAETAKFDKLDNNVACGYIREIERKLGGKLNLETLEIDKQPEFKDGDIVTMHKKNCDIVFIFNRLRIEGSFYYYAFHALQTNNTGVIDCHITLPCAWTFFEGKMNFATDSEKQQLFDALAKKGKAWDAEKKMIVNLKPKIELKPFEKVLVRNRNTQRWNVDLFGFKSDGVNVFYHCVGSSWNFCIPYIGNESLLGTTKDMED